MSERHEFDAHGHHEGASCWECRRLRLNAFRFDEIQGLILAALYRRATP